MAYFVSVTTISVLLLAGIPETFAFIPRICANNATTSAGICCPVPTGFAVPCGGQGRGKCIEIPESRIEFSPAPEIYKDDDRIDWPRRFFKYECSCEGNYMGYMCQECRFGFRGENCTERYTRIRKDISTLTTEEKLHFRTIVSQSKHVLTDYVALGNVYDIDPITTPTFVNVSIYDHMAYIHAYASRNTITNGSNTVCSGAGSPRFPPFDPAHHGPAFPPWHRLYLLTYERELQKLSGKDDFALPYYNWTAGPEAYKAICSNDLFGETNYSDPEFRVSRESVFYDWHNMCQERKEMKGCRVCNASQIGLPLRRRPGGANFTITMPSKEVEEYALTLPLYDVPPYNSSSSGEFSFRNVMEGYTSQNGKGIYLHNRAHYFHQGTILDVPASANDPLFMPMHAFVDKHFEMWMRKNPTPITQIPEGGAALGHNRDDPLVGFFPRHINSWYLTDSRVFGYDFDDMVAEDNNDAGIEHPGWIVTIVMAAVIVILLVVVTILIVKLRAAKQPSSEPVMSETTPSRPSSDEKAPLLT